MRQIKNNLYLISLIFLLFFTILITNFYSTNKENNENNLINFLNNSYLKKSLKTVLKESGPIAAVEYCNIAAVDITDRISNSKSIFLKRTSLKVRNKDNVATSWEKDVLNNFENRKRLGESVNSIDYQEAYTDNNNKSFFRYMKAIPTGKVCLTCHGSNINPNLRTRINELYPEDKAYGFEIGDIRGAFTIQIPLSN